MIGRIFKAKLLVFLIFFVGIATGALLMNFYDSRVSGSPVDRGNVVARGQRDINSLHDYLGLDEAQREQVRTILEEMRGEFRQLQKQTQPQFAAIREKSRDRIRGVMNEEQRKKYDEFLETRANRPRRRN